MISFKKSIHKKVVSATMTMMLAVSSILPVTAAEQGNEGSTDRQTRAVTLPQAAYTYDFEGAITDGGATAVTNGSTGKVEIVEDATKGKVLHITDGGTESFGQNYYQLASDIFKNVTVDTGATFSMDVKIPATIESEWSVLFSTNPGYNQWNLWKINANLACDINAGTPHAYGGAGTTSLKRDEWHNITVTLTKESLDVYVDGILEKKGIVPTGGAETFATDGWTGPINQLSNNTFNVLGAGGFPTNNGKTGDRDISECYYDNVKFYSQALTSEQVEYLVKGAADKTELDKAIAAASSVKIELYTDDTAKIFTDKLANAQAVKLDAQAEQAAVDAAKDELVAAQNALVKKSVNLTDGIVLNTDFTTSTSVIDSANKTVTSGGYILTALDASTVENGYIQLATADSSKQAGVSLDCDVVQNLSVENGFTISARIDTSTATTTDWRDIFNITDSEEALIARYTYGFVTFAGKENVFPGADCKNGFAWDSCKSYQTGVIKTYTLTADSNGVSMYVDGVLACRKTDISLYDFNFVFKNAEHIYIGREFFGGDGDTQGKLYGVSVYNRALNEAEVEALHTTPPSATTVSTDINVMAGSNVTVKDGEKTIYTKTVDASKKAVLKGLTPEKEYTYTIELPEGYVVKDGASLENVPFTAKKDTSDDITIEAVKKAFVLSETKLNLNTNDTSELTLASAVPEGTTIAKAVSSDETIATVQLADGKITVTAVGAGTATITATASNGLTAKCQVTVSDVKATEIVLSKTETVLEKGKTETITATVKPDNTTDKTVAWTSGNEKIVTVNNGVITAVGAGTAKIVARCGDVMAECSVTVEVPITGIVLDKTELALENKITGDNTIYATDVIEATIQPEDATDDKEITWTSSDENIVTVKDGNVTAVSDGTAVITATTSNGKTATCTVTVTSTEIKDLISAEEITLDKTEGELEEGKTLQLTATITPEDATIKECNWSSSDETIAVVNANGLVTAKKAGTVTITVTTKDGSELSAKCEITVTSAKVEVTGIILDKTSAEVEEGKTVQLTATVTPDNATVKDCEFTSSDETVAAVDANGLVTAKQAGTAVITVTSKDNPEISAECEITVTAAAPEKVEVTGIILDKTSAEAEEGKTVQLTATVTPDNATVKDCEFTSSDETVAAVDANGLVTAKQAGTAVITVTSKDNPEISAECKITITSVKTPEDGPAIKGEDGKEGWEVIQDYVEKTEEGSVVVVDMKGTTNIQGSVVEQAKKNKVSLVFEISNEIKWTIKAEDITEDKIQDIDLRVTKDTENIEEAKIKEVAKEKKTTQINLSHNGNFGFTAVLTINLNKENAGKFANLYYFNTAKQVLEYMCSDKVDNDGNANLTFQHASDYVIIYDEVAHNINNDNNDSEPDNNNDKPDDKGEKPDDNNNKPVNNNQNDTDNNKGTTPKTGDSSEAGKFLLVMICAITALLGINMEKLGKKRKE